MSDINPNEIQMGYYRKSPVDRHCDGCGVIVGPNSPFYHTGFEVRDGEFPGFYHNKQCYLRKISEGGDKRENISTE